METMAGIAIVPLIVGLVAAATTAGLPKKPHAIILALALGVLVSVGYAVAQGASATAVVDALIVGLGLGLSAIGIHSGAKNLVRG